MTDAVTVEYVLDDAGAQALVKGGTHVPRGARVLGQVASTALAALAMIIGMMAGFALALWLGIFGTAQTLLIFGSGVGLVLICYGWSRRVNAQLHRTQVEMLRPGSPIAYRFDKTGIHLGTWYQSWHTRWAGVTDIRQSADAVTIMAGLLCFAIPRSAFGDGSDRTVQQIHTLWAENK